MKNQEIEPCGSSRPRPNDLAVKALSEDTALASRRIASEALRHQNEANRTAAKRQIGQAAPVAAANTSRPFSALGTDADPTLRANDHLNARVGRAERLERKARRNERGGAKSLAHDADPLTMTSHAVAANCIKIESEPMLHADSHTDHLTVLADDDAVGIPA